MAQHRNMCSQLAPGKAGFSKENLLQVQASGATLSCNPVLAETTSSPGCQFFEVLQPSTILSQQPGAAGLFSSARRCCDKNEGDYYYFRTEGADHCENELKSSVINREVLSSEISSILSCGDTANFFPSTMCDGHSDPTHFVQVLSSSSILSQEPGAAVLFSHALRSCDKNEGDHCYFRTEGVGHCENDLKSVVKNRETLSSENSSTLCCGDTANFFPSTMCDGVVSHSVPTPSMEHDSCLVSSDLGDTELCKPNEDFRYGEYFFPASHYLFMGVKKKRKKKLMFCDRGRRASSIDGPILPRVKQRGKKRRKRRRRKKSRENIPRRPPVAFRRVGPAYHIGMQEATARYRATRKGRVFHASPRAIRGTRHFLFFGCANFFKVGEKDETYYDKLWNKEFDVPEPVAMKVHVVQEVGERAIVEDYASKAVVVVHDEHVDDNSKTEFVLDDDLVAARRWSQGILKPKAVDHTAVFEDVDFKAGGIVVRHGCPEKVCEESDTNFKDLREKELKVHSALKSSSNFVWPEDRHIVVYEDAFVPVGPWAHKSTMKEGVDIRSKVAGVKVVEVSWTPPQVDSWKSTMVTKADDISQESCDPVTWKVEMSTDEVQRELRVVPRVWSRDACMNSSDDDCDCKGEAVEDLNCSLVTQGSTSVKAHDMEILSVLDIPAGVSIDGRGTVPAVF